MSDVRMDEDLRKQALERVRKRRDFWPHLLVYVVVNAMLVVVWTMVGPSGFFWPIIPIAGWGIGIVMHAWDAFWRSGITDEDVDREMARMQHH